MCPGENAARLKARPRSDRAGAYESFPENVADCAKGLIDTRWHLVVTGLQPDIWSCRLARAEHSVLEKLAVVRDIAIGLP